MCIRDRDTLARNTPVTTVSAGNSVPPAHSFLALRSRLEPVSYTHLDVYKRQSWNNPDRYWISILTLVNWVGNVLLPLYGAGQVVLAVVHFAGLLERMTIGEAWVRNVVAAMCCFGLSGLLRLGEFWIQHGTAGVR